MQSSLPPLNATTSVYSCGSTERHFIREFDNTNSCLPDIFKSGRIYGYKDIARGVDRGMRAGMKQSEGKLKGGKGNPPMDSMSMWSSSGDSSFGGDLWLEDSSTGHMATIRKVVIEGKCTVEVYGLLRTCNGGSSWEGRVELRLWGYLWAILEHAPSNSAAMSTSYSALSVLEKEDSRVCARHHSVEQRLRALAVLEDKHRRYLEKIHELRESAREDAAKLRDRLKSIRKEGMEIRAMNRSHGSRDHHISVPNLLELAPLDGRLALENVKPNEEDGGDGSCDVAGTILHDMYRRISPHIRGKSHTQLARRRSGKSEEFANYRRRSVIGVSQAGVDLPMLERLARITRWLNSNSGKWGPSAQPGALNVKALMTMTPRGALRKVLEVRCGSLKKAYQSLDLNGNGEVSLHEFEDGLKSLGVPWADITGTGKFRTVFKLFDENDTGEVNLVEFLGVRPHPTRWEDMTDEQKWHHYTRGVCDMLPSAAVATTMMDGCYRNKRRLSGDRTAAWKANAPSPYATLARIRAMEDSRHFVKMRFRSGDHTVTKKYVKVGTDLRSLRNERQAAKQRMEDSRRRCDAMIHEMGHYRKDIGKASKELYTSLVASADLNAEMFNEAGDKKSKNKFVDRAEKNRRALERRRTEAADHLNAHSGGGSVFEANRQRCFDAEAIDKVHIFMNLEAELSPREREVRKVAKEYDIPLIDAEDVCPGDSSLMNRAQFETLILHLLKDAISMWANQSFSSLLGNTAAAADPSREATPEDQDTPRHEDDISIMEALWTLHRSPDAASINNLLDVLQDAPSAVIDRWLLQIFCALVNAAGDFKDALRRLCGVSPYISLTLLGLAQVAAQDGHAADLAEVWVNEDDTEDPSVTCMDLVRQLGDISTHVATLPFAQRKEVLEWRLRKVKLSKGFWLLFDTWQDISELDLPRSFLLSEWSSSAPFHVCVRLQDDEQSVPEGQAEINGVPTVGSLAGRSGGGVLYPRSILCLAPKRSRKSASTGSRGSSSSPSKQPPRRSTSARPSAAAIVLSEASCALPSGRRLISVVAKAGSAHILQERLALSMIAWARARWMECPRGSLERSLGEAVKLYRVFSTTSGGVVEAIPNAVSLDALKKAYDGEQWGSLRAHFEDRWPGGGSKKGGADTALDMFCRSMAAYSAICYVLGVRDRHNANILLCDNGSICHVDFGFFLTNSPGNVAFEPSFKLTEELVEALGGESSRRFGVFREMVVRGCIVLRREIDTLKSMIELLFPASADGWWLGPKLPCFAQGKEQTLVQMDQRLRIELTEKAFREYLLELIDQSVANWRSSMSSPPQRPSSAEPIFPPEPLVPRHVLESLLCDRSSALVSRVPLSDEALRRLSFELEALSTKLASEALSCCKERVRGMCQEGEGSNSDAMIDGGAAEEDDLMRELEKGDDSSPNQMPKNEHRLTLEDVVMAAKSLSMVLPSSVQEQLAHG
ncbi:Phosphatidylinositol 4-kinase beta [Perkinsus chesapeaki]|uniref:Phosphatidylinositol 4-kinase beta n=1 Tax=Perkinsus chesapeaki TaxID=330153 RepID=A0A7J6N3X5_PERCH|nr:Phosphatidylinositol 4-kinase beta [Perkinsus chesapeaki]